MQEIGEFDVKISGIPNGLEEYMTFTINKDLVFIYSMQFMNSGLNVLVKNLTDSNFKYLSQDFNGEQLNLVKQKGVYPYEWMNSFETFYEDKLPDRCEFYSSLKDECIRNKDEYISEKDGYISEKDEHISEDDGYNSEEHGDINKKDYLHPVNVWNVFKMKSLG